MGSPKLPQDHKAPRKRTSKAPNALAAEISEVGGELPTFEMFGRSWEVRKKPNTLMVAQLATVSAEDPNAVGVVFTMVKSALHPQDLPEFLAAYNEAAPADGNDAELFSELVAGIMGATTGRPTT